MTATITGPVEIPWSQADPYIGECPPWCEQALAGEPHKVESSDEDRWHYGPMQYVPVRSLMFEASGLHSGERPAYVAGQLQAYPRLNVLHRDPQIWLGEGESNKGWTLTVDEARHLAEALLEIVDAVGGES
jgi:hypothetical protein